MTEHARRRVLFRVDYGPDFPFWSESGGGLDYSIFGPLTAPDLRSRLSTWCRGFWGTLEDDFDAASHLAEGRELFEETRVALSGTCELVWDNTADQWGGE